MVTSYIDFEIRFEQRTSDGFPFTAASGTGGEVRHTMRDITTEPRYQELAGLLEGGRTSEALLTELGTILYNALFQGDVLQRLAYTQGSQGDNENRKGIRLKIKSFPGETAIAAVPWEYLYDPNRGNPFVLLDISLVRYPQAAVGIPTTEAKLPLRVLLTAAQPADQAQAEIEAELDEVKAAIDEFGLAGNQIEIIEERHLTRAKLQRYLRRGGFHVWHFAGHGDFLENKQTGVLLFEDGEGNSERVQANELGILLNNSGVRLVVLDACKSGRVTTEPFRNIAPSLTANNIPAVIAMQFSVPGESTLAFAGEFYRSLAEGLPIDACVTEGRKSVAFASGLRRADWGMPVVYTRASDGILFNVPSKPNVQVEQPSASVVNDLSGANIQGGVTINTGGTTISGNIINTGATDEEREQKLNEISNNKRSYWKLKNQAAIFGLNAPPHILIQLEDLERDIHKREKELGLPLSIL